MEIVNALWITLIGMGLVFVAILLLWGLMALLVRVTAEKEAPPLVEEEAAPNLVMDTLPDAALLLDRKRRAAAAAAAVALSVAATLKASLPADKERTHGRVSPWQVINRANQINQRMIISRKKVNR